jgi:hypothetical protein
MSLKLHKETKLFETSYNLKKKKYFEVDVMKSGEKTKLFRCQFFDEEKVTITLKRQSSARLEENWQNNFNNFPI